MSSTAPLSGTDLRDRVVRLSLALSAPALAVAVLGISILLDLTPLEWWWLVAQVGLYGVVVGMALLVALGRVMAPLLAPDCDRVAFAVVMNLPRKVAALVGIGWLAPAVAVALAMGLRFESWGSFESAVVILSGAATGFVCGTYLPFLVKRAAAPLRDELAGRIPNPDERRGLIRATSLSRKLTVSAVGVSVAPVVFGVLFAHSQSTRSLADLTARWQHEILALDPQGVAALGDPVGEGTSLGPFWVGVVDPTSSEPVPFDGEILSQLREQMSAGATRGSVRARDGRSAVAWRRDADGRLRLAAASGDWLQASAGYSWTVIAGLLLLSSAIAAGLAHLLSSDVGRSARALRDEVERLESGDLRTGTVHESEDELGDLMRSFESMSASLRATVRRVTDAADRVEGTAAEVARVSESVASVTAAQVRGIEEAASSMESINGQVKGISGSTQELSRLVQHSSTSILELGAAGDDLNQTASQLSGQAEDVSGSIEQMVQSARQVAVSTEALAEASVDTSTSMEEMATSMGAVDRAAEETARVFEQVVVRAESGQEKVRQTITGMEEIREATETADRVIRNLGSRTDEIGAIVDVIDDVADETNLLALNAAIIAAQAGEHGRAFSVVADQIKDLADRVLSSTKEIGSLIRAVQSEGANAIGAIERGTQSVAGGVDLSAEAGVSLEEITRAARDSGARIEAIVTAVREQAKAADHVVALMERVRVGVEEIRGAAEDQDRGHDVIYRGARAMQQVAERVRSTTEEQTRGSQTIRESSDAVRSTVEQIRSVLQEQAAATAEAVEVLAAVFTRTRANEGSAQSLDEATHALVLEAEALRQDVRRFRT
jgi:methyl-accepting chemotaxis protein